MAGECNVAPELLSTPNRLMQEQTPDPPRSTQGQHLSALRIADMHTCRRATRVAPLLGHAEFDGAPTGGMVRF